LLTVIVNMNVGADAIVPAMLAAAVMTMNPMMAVL
jgi:hypothetical protein